MAIKRDPAQEAAIIAWIQVIGQIFSSGEGDWSDYSNSHGVRHVTGTGSGLLGGIPRVVVQISALTLNGPL